MSASCVRGLSSLFDSFCSRVPVHEDLRSEILAELRLAESLEEQDETLQQKRNDSVLNLMILFERAGFWGDNNHDGAE